MPPGSAGLTKSVRAHPRNTVPWLLAVPAVLALLLFHFLPIGVGAYFAFTDWDGLSHANWVGLQNFRGIAHDATARHALSHTLELAFCFVVLEGERLRGRAPSVELLGAEQLVHVELPVTLAERQDGLVTARFDAQTRVAPGDLVELSVNTPRLRFFDLATGRAIS